MQTSTVAQALYRKHPLPKIQAVIEVLWDPKLDYWRVGTVVAWNEKQRRHEISYHDEPGEEPVLERFWGKQPARYRYFGEPDIQPASAVPLVVQKRRAQSSKAFTQTTNASAQLPVVWPTTELVVAPKLQYFPVPDEETVERYAASRPTLDEQWWDHANTWEMPHFSRSQWPEPMTSNDNTGGEATICAEFYQRRIREINISMSRQIVMRCLPGLKHEVGKTAPMVVGTMDVYVWDLWKHTILSQTPCDKASYRSISYPDYGYIRKEIVETLYWKLNLPILDGVGWHRVKSVNTTYGTLHRAEVLSLKLTRNAWTLIVKAEFEYKTERYDDDEKLWRPF